VLELKAADKTIKYKWDNCVPGFNMPVKLTDGTWLKPTIEWQQLNKDINNVDVDQNFYINVHKS
jgi:hypothetical protein